MRRSKVKRCTYCTISPESQGQPHTHTLNMCHHLLRFLMVPDSSSVSQFVFLVTFCQTRGAAQTSAVTELLFTPWHFHSIGLLRVRLNLISRVKLLCCLCCEKSKQIHFHFNSWVLHSDVVFYFRSVVKCAAPAVQSECI